VNGAFRHTPYAGTKPPFTIGLSPLGDLPWLEMDETLLEELREKARLYATTPEAVVRAASGTEAAQEAVLAMVLEALAREPTHRRDGPLMHVAGCDAPFALDDDAVPAIHRAARMIQEDLVLMRREQAGWVLAAASVCFPSKWSLPQKFGQPLGAIHAAVPGYPGHMAMIVDRIFDHLKDDRPAIRFNWSIHDDARLHHPEPKRGPLAWHAEPVERVAQIRIERQTLRRLPGGEVLFTIRTHLDPVAALRGHPGGAALAAALREQLVALDAAQLAYKGLTQDAARIADALADIAATEGQAA
jgi:dimethylamine monooxygenase subunit A